MTDATECMLTHGCSTATTITVPNRALHDNPKTVVAQQVAAALHNDSNHTIHGPLVSLLSMDMRARSEVKFAQGAITRATMLVLLSERAKEKNNAECNCIHVTCPVNATTQIHHMLYSIPAYKRQEASMTT